MDSPFQKWKMAPAVLEMGGASRGPFWPFPFLSSKRKNNKEHLRS